MPPATCIRRSSSPRSRPLWDVRALDRAPAPARWGRPPAPRRRGRSSQCVPGVSGNEVTATARARRWPRTWTSIFDLALDAAPHAGGRALQERAPASGRPPPVRRAGPDRRWRGGGGARPGPLPRLAERRASTRPTWASRRAPSRAPSGAVGVGAPERGQEEGEGRGGHRPAAHRAQQMGRQLRLHPGLDPGEGLQHRPRWRRASCRSARAARPRPSRPPVRGLRAVEESRGRPGELRVGEPVRGDAGRPAAEERLAPGQRAQPDGGGWVCAAGQLDLRVQPDQLTSQQIGVRGEDSQGSVSERWIDLLAAEGNIGGCRVPTPGSSAPFSATAGRVTELARESAWRMTSRSASTSGRPTPACRSSRRANRWSSPTSGAS